MGLRIVFSFAPKAIRYQPRVRVPIFQAAMPGFIGVKLCPELVFVDTEFDKYQAISVQTRIIFADYDPHFSAMSLDEAYCT